MIAGVDEAGRGPLAGPVVAAVVILPDGPPIQGLNDSKKLTAVSKPKSWLVPAFPWPNAAKRRLTISIFCRPPCSR